MQPNITVEVCAGSLQDCLYAEKAGAHRIELNNALYLGGLTPSLATLTEAKKQVKIPILTMVRPRAGGFCYDDCEMEVLFRDAEFLIQHGTDGIVFGFLNEDHTVDQENTRKMAELCRKGGVEAIFHRAFDRTEDPFAAAEALIEVGVDRVLTSGLKDTADEGIDLLKELQSRYGEKFEFCAGSGVNSSNVLQIIEETGINQVHSSFKGWYTDPTTQGPEVSYRYSDAGDYEGVDLAKLQEFMKVISSGKK